MNHLLNEQSDQSMAYETSDLHKLDNLSTQAGGRNPAHRGDTRASLADPPHEMWKTGKEPRLSHHANTARTMNNIDLTNISHHGGYLNIAIKTTWTALYGFAIHSYHPT